MTHDEPNNSAREDARPDTGPSVGEQLRRAREAQPLTLAQLSAELRIETRFLTALEEDRLDEFAAPVFVKGYLKQYGAMLGLDERDLLAQYYRQVDIRDLPVVQQKPIRLRDEDQIRHWLAGGVVLAILIVGAVVWWRTQPTIEPVIDDVAEPEQAEPEPLEQARPPVVDESVVPIAVTDRPTAPAVAPPPPAVADVEGPDPSDLVQVEINFIEDCWTEISDARGERLFYGLGSAGARSRFSASLPISIFLGNAGGVELTVNGDSYPIPVGSRQGNLARFVIADPGL